LASSLLVGIQKISVFNAYQLGYGILNLFLNVVAGLFRLGVVGFLLASIIGAWLPALLLLLWLMKQGGHKLTFNKQVFLTGIRLGLKAYIITLLGYLVMRSNTFILRDSYGGAEVGCFSIAIQVADVLAILPASAALVLFPALVRETGGRWQSTLKSGYAVGAILTVVCACAAVLAEPCVRLAFGSSYARATPMLLWMLPGVLCLGLTSVVSQYLAASGYPRTLIWLWGSAWVTVLISSRLLVPRYGGTGAAMALSLTYCLLFPLILALAWVTNRRLHWDAVQTAFGSNH